MANTQAIDLSLRAPFNTEILTPTRKSPDKDLDQLATQLLEELELVNGTRVGSRDSVQHEREDCASSLSSKPASFVRVRPQHFTTGNQEKRAGANYTHKALHEDAIDGSSEVSSMVRTLTSADEKSLTSGVSRTPPTSSKVDVGIPLDSLHGNSKYYSFRKSQQSCGRKGKHDSVTYPPLDTIHANILDLSKDHKDDQPGQASSENGLTKLLRRAKAFGNIRLVKDHLVIHQTDNEERLGSLLTPPPGSCHFDVQLVLCGLLRRNAASPYELYNFFSENGFFTHLSLPPNYTEWAAEYSEAVKNENPFYREGVRVGLEGDMDFLRTIFQQWCDAWHDWRASRPIPKSRRA